MSVIPDGVWPDLDEATYRAHPAPSASGLVRLLPPSTPAQFRHWADTAEEAIAPHLDLGRATHSLALGAGAPVVELPGDDLRKREVATAQAGAVAAGHIPLKPAAYRAAMGMAEAVAQHPLASALLRSEGGAPEASAFATVKHWGLQIKCRYDHLPVATAPGQRLVIADLKTARDIDDESISKHIEQWKYHFRASLYLRVADLLGLGPDGLAWAWVWVRSEPPHLVRVTQLHPDDLDQGDALLDMALDLYTHCSTTGQWPGYGADQIPAIARPAWAFHRTQELIQI